MSTITLYGTPLSGHVHRVALLLRMLALPNMHGSKPRRTYGRAQPSAGSTHSARSVLQDGDLTLADSNAILVYLVKRYAPDSHWLPEQPAAAAGAGTAFQSRR